MSSTQGQRLIDSGSLLPCLCLQVPQATLHAIVFKLYMSLTCPVT